MFDKFKILLNVVDTNKKKINEETINKLTQEITSIKSTKTKERNYEDIIEELNLTKNQKQQLEQDLLLLNNLSLSIRLAGICLNNFSAYVLFEKSISISINAKQ